MKKREIFQWIGYNPISILYKFQIDISSNSREIKYQNIGRTHRHTDTHTQTHTQTDRHTGWKQYLATLSGGEVNIRWKCLIPEKNLHRFGIVLTHVHQIVCISVIIHMHVHHYIQQYFMDNKTENLTTIVSWKWSTNYIIIKKLFAPSNKYNEHLSKLKISRHNLVGTKLHDCCISTYPCMG